MGEFYKATDFDCELWKMGNISQRGRWSKIRLIWEQIMDCMSVIEHRDEQGTLLFEVWLIILSKIVKTSKIIVKFLRIHVT